VGSRVISIGRETDESETPFASSLIPHWRCSKQTPVEGALLCWSFNLLLIFQPRSVSFPYFRVLMLTLVGENFRWSKTTSFLLGFSTCRATNRFLRRELCHGEVLYLLMFSDQVWPFCLLQCFGFEIDGEKFCSIWKYYIPFCIPNWQIHKEISTERALQRRSSESNHGFFRFFFLILCCWTEIELTVGVTSKKANAQCTEASIIWCHWKMWRRWTINRAADQEQKLSLVDDWRHCCGYSWLKRRGATSMGHGQAVFPQKTV